MEEREHSALPTASRQRKKLHEDLLELQSQIDEQAVLLEKMFKQNKKILKHLKLMSIAGWLRIIFLYLPIIALILLSVFYLPAKFREVMKDPYGLLFRGKTESVETSTSSIFSKFTPSQIDEVKKLLGEFQSR